MRRIVESESLPIEITGLAFIEQRGSVGCYLQRKPTPAEIKAAHPKCGSCKHSVHIPNELFKYCKNHNSSNNYRRPVGDNHYCPHHEPKDQP